MKNIILLILLFSTLVCFSQEPLETLGLAYKQKSFDRLENFFDNWKNKTPGYDYTDSLEIKRLAAELYISFYNPFNLKTIGIETNDSTFSWVKYLIIQNKLIIFQMDSDSIPVIYRSVLEDSVFLARDSIIDFRPKVTFPNISVLYLTKDYEKVLLEFLGDKYTPLGYGGIMNPARARGKSLKKQRFLNELVCIIYGHWGGYWHLETHPEVLNIVFNKSKTVAKVNYRIGYRGGEATFEYKENEWLFTEGQLTWVE